MVNAAAAASLLEKGIRSRAFPGAAIEAGRHDRVLWNAAFGRFTYAEDAPEVRADTVYDLASLTKVIATVPRVMQAMEAGALALETRVAERLAAWRGADRQAVTIGDLLEHASGLTAYLPFFRDHQGRADFERAICTLPLEYAPRTQSIYSDLGFILLGFILDDVGFGLVGEPRTAAESRPVGESRTVGSSSLQAGDPICFNPPRGWKHRTAPTELDLWRGRLIQGEVHDENAWALGGVAGHAGMFGTAAAVGSFAREVLTGLRGVTTFAQPDTFARFARKSTVPGSSRALGWDTMLPTSSCGTRFSPRALGHTGFTGTSLWIDPELDLYVVLLTNRVHPSRDNNAIQPIRRAVHDALAGQTHPARSSS
jgi:CubicO group peptidase (beta-lactamase class C family)